MLNLHGIEAEEVTFLYQESQNLNLLKLRSEKFTDEWKLKVGAPLWVF
jgi:hypothetical protein